MKEQNGKTADSSSTGIQNGSDSEVKTEGPPERRQLVPRILFQVFCLAWLIPVMYMLIRNWMTWIIGASAWCPHGECWAELFSPHTGKVFNTARKFDQESHDLVGALQFAAKALEVWFVVIATSFVYLYTMFLAESTDGLPVGYLTWPNEFADLTSIFDSSLWTTAFSRRSRGTGLAYRLQSFVLLTLFMCILANLMGPAIAVIIIPSLQWISTPNLGDQAFNGMASNAAPNPEALLTQLQLQYSTTQCSVDELAAGNYSCSRDTLGWSLDAITSSFIDSIAFDKGGLNYGLVQEGDLSTLVANITGESLSSKDSIWTSCRQSLRQLSYDANVIASTSQGKSKEKLEDYRRQYESYPGNGDYGAAETYQIYNRSLGMKISRNGPMFGARPNGWNPLSGDTWISVVDDSRSIRCYSGYSMFYYSTVTDPVIRCIRLGSGWDSNNKQLNFSIAALEKPQSDDITPGIDFRVISSDRATFLKGNELPSWLPAGCLTNRVSGNVPSGLDCDWDRLFSTDVPLSNRTRNVNTWEFYSTDDSVTPIVATDFVAYIGFAQYQLDLSPATNPLLITQTLNVPQNGEPFAIDPHWAALAWSADISGTISADRTTPQLFIEGIGKGGEVATLAGNALTLTIFHMLTLLPFSTTRMSETVIDSQHPLLQRNGTVYLYAYRLGSSRTSVFSAVVVIMGIVVVVAHAIIGVLYYRPSKSVAQVIIAALQHHPQGEFSNSATEKDAVRTRFTVEHDRGARDLKFRGQR